VPEETILAFLSVFTVAKEPTVAGSCACTSSTSVLSSTCRASIRFGCHTRKSTTIVPKMDHKRNQALS